jgi:hypothetical protein
MLPPDTAPKWVTHRIAYATIIRTGIETARAPAPSGSTRCTNSAKVILVGPGIPYDSDNRREIEAGD